MKTQILNSIKEFYGKSNITEEDDLYDLDRGNLHDCINCFFYLEDKFNINYGETDFSRYSKISKCIKLTSKLIKGKKS